VVLVYMLVGCGEQDCNPVYTSSPPARSGQGCGTHSGGPYQSGGCGVAGEGPNGSLGQGDFTYVCPSAAGVGRDAWCDLHAIVALAEATDASGDSDAGPPDASLVSAAELSALDRLDGGIPLVFSLTGTVPDVAVGAAFELTYAPISPAPGLGAPAPALGALSTRVPLGSALAGEGWAGFVVRHGSTIFDYVHVRARPVASLLLWVPPSSGPMPPPPGTVLGMEAIALSVDGTALAGAMECTFDSSDPSVATVTGTGPAAQLTVVGVGPVTVTSHCLGVSGQTTLSFRGTAAVNDAAAIDAAEDGGDENPPPDASDGNSEDGG
jgi:hypothetical protein